MTFIGNFSSALPVSLLQVAPKRTPWDNWLMNAFCGIKFLPWSKRPVATYGDLRCFGRLDSKNGHSRKVNEYI